MFSLVSRCGLGEPACRRGSVEHDSLTCEYRQTRHLTCENASRQFSDDDTRSRPLVSRLCHEPTVSAERGAPPPGCTRTGADTEE